MKKFIKKQFKFRKNKLLQKFNLCLVYLSALSLMVSSPGLALAQRSSGAPQVTTFGQVTGVAGQLFQTLGNQMIQSQQQIAANARLASFMQGFAPQQTPARFFPGCPVPKAFAAKPVACEEEIPFPSPINPPPQLSFADGLSKQGQHITRFYEKMLSPVNDSPVPTGLQCLEEGRKAAESQLQDKLNSLTNAQTKIKQQTQLFRDANQSLLSDMKKINQELDGTDSTSLEGKGSNLADQFQDSSCKEAIDASFLSRSKGGLRGVKASFETSAGGKPPLFTTAGRLLKDRGLIQNHLNDQLSRMTKDIKNNGIDSWVSDPGLNDLSHGGLTKFGGLGESISREIRNFKKEKARLQKEIQKLGVSLPAFEGDPNSRKTSRSYGAGIENQIQRSSINDCVSGKDQTGVALSTDQILNGLRLPPGLQGGSTLQDFKEALAAQLASGGSPEQKLKKIKALQKQYGVNIQVEFRDSSRSVQKLSPFELYRKQIKSCQTTFAQSGGIEKMKEVNKIIAKAKKLQRGLTQKLKTAAYNRVVSCGSSSGARSGACNDPSNMDPASGGFCLQTATKCAQHVNTCYKKVKNIIQKKEKEIKRFGGIYNRNMEGLIARQDQILKGLQRQVVGDQEFLKRFFPGASYKFPKDLFVKMPEMKDGTFEGQGLGVRLRNGGDVGFLDDMAGKIDLLKTSLNQQKTKVDAEIKKYQTNQKTVMENNKRMFEELIKKCDAIAKGFRNKVTQANAAGAQADQTARTEAAAANADFCRRFGRIASARNPCPACENRLEGLLEASNNAAVQLDPTTDNSLARIEEICASCQSESDSSSGNDSSGRGSVLQRVCDAGSFNSGFSRFVNDSLSQLPSGSRDDAREYIMDGDGTLSNLNLEGNNERIVEGLRSIRENTTPAETPAPASTSETPASTTPTQAVLQGDVTRARTAMQDALGTINNNPTGSRCPALTDAPHTALLAIIGDTGDVPDNDTRTTHMTDRVERLNRIKTCASRVLPSLRVEHTTTASNGQSRTSLVDPCGPPIRNQENCTKKESIDKIIAGITDSTSKLASHTRSSNSPSDSGNTASNTNPCANANSPNLTDRDVQDCGDRNRFNQSSGGGVCSGTSCTQRDANREAAYQQCLTNKRSSGGGGIGGQLAQVERLRNRGDFQRIGELGAPICNARSNPSRQQGSNPFFQQLLQGNPQTGAGGFGI